MNWKGCFTRMYLQTCRILHLSSTFKSNLLINWRLYNLHMKRVLKLFSMVSCLLQSLPTLILPNESVEVESPLPKVWKSDVSNVRPSSERNSPDEGVNSWKWVSFQTFQGGNSTFINLFVSHSHRRSSTVLETRIILPLLNRRPDSSIMDLLACETQTKIAKSI